MTLMDDGNSRLDDEFGNTDFNDTSIFGLSSRKPKRKNRKNRKSVKNTGKSNRRTIKKRNNNKVRRHIKRKNRKISTGNKRVKYTKRGQPYIIDKKTGKAKFIKRRV